MGEEITPMGHLHLVPKIPQRIIIEVHGNEAKISVSGLEPLQVIMLLSQFIGMAANELKKAQSSIVVPKLVG